MLKNGIYSATIKRGKPIAKILAIVFGVCTAVLLLFVVWSALSFGSGKTDGYKPQAQEISDLKIELETQKKTVETLKKENAQLQEKVAQQEKEIAELTKPEEPMPTEEPDEVTETTPDDTSLPEASTAPESSGILN